MNTQTVKTALEAIDAPWHVPQALRIAADLLREDASELDASWQDSGAGDGWRIVARQLEDCANRTARLLASVGLGE